MATGRAGALKSVEDAMIRIRRSQSRRAIARLMAQRLGAPFDRNAASVVDVIEAASEAGEIPTVGSVARQLAIDPSRASRLVAAAVKTGHVLRVSVQDDGRSAKLEMTKRGRLSLEAVQKFRAGVFAGAMQGWTERECVSFSRLLQRFITALEGMTMTAAEKSSLGKSRKGRRIRRPPL